MFLSQIKTFSKTQFWRYILGFLVITLCHAIGNLPIFIAWSLKKGEDFSENGLVTQITKGYEVLGNTPQTEFMSILSKNTTLIFLLLPFVLTVLGIIPALKWFHNLKLKNITTARKKIDRDRIFFSFKVFTVISIALIFIEYWITPEEYIWNFKWQPFLTLCTITIILIPIQSSVEEWIFRGYLMQGFASLFKNRLIPLILTSILFGILHLNNPEVSELGYFAGLFYIGTGLFLGIITLMDDGLELALGFHAANNIILALFLTADYSVLQTDAVLKQIGKSEVSVQILLPVLVLYPVLIIVFAKKYRWTNWRGRLLGKL